MDNPLMKTNRKTVAWSYAFSKNLLFAASLFVMSLPSACITGRDQRSPDGKIIPGKNLFDIREYKYLCEPLVTNNLEEIKDLLNQYGKNGWQLSGFITSQGSTVGYCVKR